MKKMFMLAALLLWGLVAVTGYAQEKPAVKPEAKAASGDANARAKQILEMAQQAKGSLEKLKAVRDFTSRADVSASIQGQSFDLSITTYAQAPDKTRSEINIPSMGMTMVQTFNGTSAWMDIPGQGTQDAPSELTDEAKRSAAREWFVNFLISPAGKEIEATALEDAQVNGKAADVVAVTIGDAKVTIYFDKQTHLTLKTAYDTLNQQAEKVKGESLYDDYKEVSGIKFPYKVTLLRDGEKFAESKVLEVKVNAGIEASKFTKQ
jgi:hypothetical protein